MQQRPETTTSTSDSTPTQPDARLKNGSVMEVRVEGVSPDGFGTATVFNHVVHIPDTAPGDRGTIRIEHISHQKASAWARLLSVEHRGLAWKRHFCEESIQEGGKCGGCPLGHIAKDVVRDVKLSEANTAISSADIHFPIATLFTGESLRYRNKSNFVVHRLKSGNARLGSYSPRSHRFATMDSCRIHTRIIGIVQREIQQLLDDSEAAIHPALGGFRYITIKSFETGAVLVDVVLNGDPSEHSLAICKQILGLNAVHGVTVTSNDTQGNQLRTQSSTLAGGKDTLLEKLGPITLLMKAGTFFQLNTEVATKMYGRAASWCNDSQIVWDLYSGIGGLGLTVAKEANASLFGCDSVSDAIALARQNAAENNISATYEVVNLSSDFPAQWPAPDTILVNPPRKGIDEYTLAQLLQLDAPQLIYMSCNPASFARDTKQLCETGYTIKNIEAFDMLPHTSHVELLCLLVRSPRT